MNSTGELSLSVRSTADLIAAVPYLLGFHPAESVVVLALRDKRVVFAARGDLPDPGTPTELDDAADYISSIVARQGGQAATVIGYGPAERVTPIVQAVRVALARVDLRVIEVLRVTGDRYWSYLCEDPDCCPVGGTPFDAASTEVAAAATFAGQVALPDRDALSRQVAAIGGITRESMRQATARAEERLAELLAAALVAPPSTLAREPVPPSTSAREPVPPSTSAREPASTSAREPGSEPEPASPSPRDREPDPAASGPVPSPGADVEPDRRELRALRRAGELAVGEALERHGQGGHLTDDEVAWLSLLLTHLPVRDHAWERTGAEGWHQALWTEIVQRAEPGLVAAPASLLAFAAWRAGQGALAAVALERALSDQPDYSLALLLADALRSGVPPSRLDGWPTSVWRTGDATRNRPPGRKPRNRGGQRRPGRRGRRR